MGWRWFSGFVCAAIVFGASAQLAHTASRQAAAQPPRQAAPGQAAPAPEMRIAAVVNDEVISVFDLVSRMRMVMVSSNIPDTPETRERLGGQVLHSLIDEKLELQEAKKQNISANDAELKNALDQIEKQNNMKSGQLNEFMQARGIDRASLVDQLTASIVWAKLVRRQAAQSVEISDEEIDDALKRAKEHANEPQSRVAEIFLSVDSPAQEDQVRQLAERLTQQMHQGARFSAVARQFSQSATAAVGGDMGWVRPDQLPAELGKVVTQLRPGSLSEPIHTGGGYYLLLVLDRRNGSTGGGEQDAVYDIVQVVFPIAPNAPEPARRQAVAEAENIRNAAKDCPSFLKIGKEKAPQLSSEGKLRAGNISPQLRTLVDKLQIGQASQPIVQRNGVGVIMVCAKNTGGGGVVTREDVVEQLTRERLDTVARRYLRDLRRAAYVDVRV
ncbi:MAG: peptidylprolyl isomerase [Alphaproteobacteria bacterium]|nr:peptidylprolyl isomerase [Alphaproteobacteria bacterium]